MLGRMSERRRVMIKKQKQRDQTNVVRVQRDQWNELKRLCVEEMPLGYTPGRIVFEAVSQWLQNKAKEKDELAKRDDRILMR